MLTKDINFGMFTNIFPVVANKSEVDAWSKGCKKPMFVCGKEIADDCLTKITLGDFIRFTSCKTDNEFLSVLSNYFSLDDKLLTEKAENVLGLINWTIKTIKRYAMLLDKSALKPTSEETLAGVEKLKFGIFGLVDWYARRMRIDHDAAEATPFLRVYKCYDMDNKTEWFKRKLSQVYLKKQKAKSKKKK